MTRMRRDPTQVVVPKTSSHRADAGAAWGSLVHGLLEHAMRHRAATREDLRRLARWLTVEEPQLRLVIEQAVDTAMAVVSSPELAAARATAQCYRGGAVRRSLGRNRPGSCRDRLDRPRASGGRRMAGG